MEAWLRDLLRSVGHGPLGPLTVPARWAYVFYRELQQDQAFLRAAAMAYATLVALVPMLVLTYGVLRAVGVGDTDVDVALGALMDQVFGQVPGVRDVILPGLQRVDLRALGVISVGGLLFVAGRLYLMVEQAYNDVFNTSVQRSLPFRLLNFYFAITAVPVVLVMMTRGMGTFALVGDASFAREWFGLVLQYALLVAALKLFPSVHVRWGPAVLGAAVSFVLLEAGRWGFGLYVRLFASDDPLQFVYGSLGLIPLFLLWLYCLWVFVLLGVEVANVAQNYRSLVDAELELLESSRPRYPSVDAALQVALRVAEGFRSGEGPVSRAVLIERTGLEARTIDAITAVLVEEGLLVRAEGGWLPARPPEQVPIAEVVAAWRQATMHRVPGDPVHQVVDAALTLPGHLGNASDLPIRQIPRTADG